MNINLICGIHQSVKSVIQTTYDIVTKGHGGELRVETKVNEHTDFIFIIPYL